MSRARPGFLMAFNWPLNRGRSDEDLSPPVVGASLGVKTATAGPGTDESYLQRWPAPSGAPGPTGEHERAEACEPALYPGEPGLYPGEPALYPGEVDKAAPALGGLGENGGDHGEQVATVTVVPGGPQGETTDNDAPAAKARGSWLPNWLRQDSFRSRVSMLVAAAVGVSVALAAVATYFAVRTELYREANDNLAAAVNGAPAPQVNFFGQLDPSAYARFQERTGDQIQVIAQTPTQPEVVASVSKATGAWAKAFFPVTAKALRVFKSNEVNSQVVQTLKGSDGGTYRLATVNEGNLTVQIGYPMYNTDRTLSFLRLMLLTVVMGGVALALALGWAVGRATMKPVEDLTLAAEHVAQTQDLSATIDDSGNDELARLARSFNAMLAALSASRTRQAHLVSDAGHELRTPLTSLRTNIEVLMRNRDLPPQDRDALLGDVDAQVQELTTLVGDLVDLAREDEKPQASPEVVALDELVIRAVERARRRATSLHFEVALEPGMVTAQPALLERAVLNVLDNAAKWSPPGGTVTVRLAGGPVWHLSVADQGPGIAKEDLPHIFERFYRAATARSLPGSGLGLAIVHKVVTSHGGQVQVFSSAQGGTVVEITLPAQAPAGLSA